MVSAVALYFLIFTDLKQSLPPFFRLSRMKRFFLRKRNAAPAVVKPLPSLSFCIAMDLIGYASFAVPFFGELIDFVWAPISAVIFWRTFGGAKGLLGGSLSFLEELLPGTDILPLFTITWFMRYFKRQNNPTTLVLNSK